MSDPPQIDDDVRQIGFVDRAAPILESGDYTITVTQTVTVKRTDPKLPPMDAVTEAYVNARGFNVRGERFALDPGEVVAVFPPENDRGEYGNVLPHVVFERKTLPWERLSDPATGTTWLALLLFEQAEAPVLQQARVGDLRRDPFWSDASQSGKQPSTLKDKNTVSYADADAGFDLETGEYDWDPCQVIDVQVSLFKQIAPSVDDLQWLAHVRQAPADRKADASDEKTFDRSVVVGNRLPVPNTPCVVHLVSLEGLKPFLPTVSKDDPGKYTSSPVRAAGATADAERVRLVSLKSWTFISVDGTVSADGTEARTFSDYLEHVDMTPPTLCRDAVVVPDADKDAQKTVAAAFEMGYTAINHHTRLGDQTVSWYRGPLLPYATSPTIVPPPGTNGDTGPVITAADQAVRYDPKTGLMDVSYAVAWQTGRMLALASKAFSISLYNWKRSTTQKTAVALQGARLGAWLTPLGDGGGAHRTAAALLLKITKARKTKTNTKAAKKTKGTKATRTKGTKATKRTKPTARTTRGRR